MVSNELIGIPPLSLSFLKPRDFDLKINKLNTKVQQRQYIAFRSLRNLSYFLLDSI